MLSRSELLNEAVSQSYFVYIHIYIYICVCVFFFVVVLRYNWAWCIYNSGRLACRSSFCASLTWVFTSSLFSSSFHSSCFLFFFFFLWPYVELEQLQTTKTSCLLYFLASCCEGVLQRATNKRLSTIEHVRTAGAKARFYTFNNIFASLLQQ